jgi:hypothetical protein
MSGLIDNNPKCIITGEARNSLKLGNASMQEKQETTENLALPLQEKPRILFPC